MPSIDLFHYYLCPRDKSVGEDRYTNKSFVDLEGGGDRTFLEKRMRISRVSEYDIVTANKSVGGDFS